MQSEHDIELSRLLKEKVSQHKAPDALRRRILASVEAKRHASLRPSLPLSVAGYLGRLGQYVMAHARSLAMAATCGAAAAVLGTNLLLTPAGNDPLAEQAASSHIRALLGNHEIDVVSSDQHTVKPWFAGKLDYSPRVTDFAAQGFPLEGGRLDYLDGRVVAALAYRRHLHHIDAFTWPTADADTAPVQRSYRGINVSEWNDHGMRFLLVSDLEHGELAELRRLICEDQRFSRD